MSEPRRQTPRALVVADYPALRAGPREILQRDGIDVVGELAADELETASFEPIDVLVADVPEPAALLADVDLPAVVLVDDGEAPPLDGGSARGYVLREASREALAAAVRAVAAGLLVIDPELAGAALPLGLPASGVQPATASTLTDREQEVLRLVALGLPNKGIALELGISEHTVKFHVGSILGKLDAGSRTEAVMAAARRGLLAL